MSGTIERDERAIVSGRARLAPGVRVGPYAVIGDDVELGEDCIVHSHAVLRGPAQFGRGNAFHPFSSVGGDPQDLKYAGEPTVLEVGDRNVFRENVTVSRGTVQGGGFTRIGSDNLFMAGVHIAHDCIVGNRTNAIGLERHGFLRDRIQEIERAYRLLLRSKLNTSQALEQMRSTLTSSADVAELIAFIESAERGLVK
jgi:UDP-N-acetylglucosamine acyltransferase